MTVLTRIGFIGDVHCEDAALRLAIETLRAEGFETLICTGDVATGYGDFNACCQLLQEHAISTVRGNHDRWLLEDFPNASTEATEPSRVTPSSRQFIESLPATLDLATPWGSACLCHGLGQDDMSLISPNQSDLELDDHPVLQPIVESRRYQFLLNGHSHRRMVRTYGSLTLINAGTLRRKHDPCFAAIDFEKRQVRYWNVVDARETVPAEWLEF
jgi:putative phosphoesterase